MRENEVVQLPPLKCALRVDPCDGQQRLRVLELVWSLVSTGDWIIQLTLLLDALQRLLLHDVLQRLAILSLVMRWHRAVPHGEFLSLGLFVLYREDST